MSTVSTKNKKTQKRNNGEGTITKLDGKFMGKIMIGRKANGKPNRISVYGQTQAEVLDKINVLKYEHNLGIYIEPNRTELGDWLATWLSIYKLDNLKERTYDTYESQINTHITTNLGHIALKDLKTLHIQQAINELYDGGNGLSSATIRKIYQILNSALTDAEEQDMIGKNPAKSVRLPFLEQEPAKPFSRDEQQAFFEIAKEYYYYEAFVFANDTGVRNGELLPLNWKDIDFQKCCVHISKTLIFVKDRKNKQGNTYVLKVQDSTKTRAGIRTIPLPKRCLRMLKELKLKNGSKSQLVFPSKNGTFINPRNLLRCFSTICKRANLKGFNVHTLRHTFATHCFEADIDVKIVSKWLGHKKVAHTLDIYTHVMPEKDNEAIKMFEDYGESLKVTPPKLLDSASEITQ